MDEGYITPFDLLRGKPRILDGTIGSPNCKVGIYAVFGGHWVDADNNRQYTPPDHTFLFQEGEKWKIWHKAELPDVIKIDKVTKLDKRDRGIRSINQHLRQPDRKAGGYPSLAHPDDKCSACGAKAYWTQWCYTTVTMKTNGRIVHLCKECTINGKEEHSSRARCKLAGSDMTGPGTDRLLYEENGENNLRIKLRINSKNLHMLNDLTINYRRWSELRDDQVIISESPF